MAVKKGDVNAGFELLLESIDRVITNSNSEASRKIDSGRYDEAQAGLQFSKNLHAFREQVSDLQRQWRQEFRRDRARTTMPEPKRRETGIRNSPRPPTKLSVTFASTGERIEHNFAAKTFVETIRRIGVNKVKPLGIVISRIPLLSKDNFSDYNKSRYKADGYYVVTNTSTASKKQILETIARKLGIKIKVEIVPR